VCAASAAAITSIPPNPAPSRFCKESVSPCKLALCLFKGLPRKLSSVKLLPKTLFGRVAAVSVSMGGVAVAELPPTEGERASTFSAECWRFNYEVRELADTVKKNRRIIP
jgi:hypothetical protein